MSEHACELVGLCGACIVVYGSMADVSEDEVIAFYQHKRLIICGHKKRIWLESNGTSPTIMM